MHVLHIHQALSVDVVVANGGHRVGQGHGRARVLSRHLPLSPRAAARRGGGGGGGGEHEVGLATGGGEDRVLTHNEWLCGAVAGGGERPCARPVQSSECRRGRRCIILPPTLNIFLRH